MTIATEDVLGRLGFLREDADEDADYVFDCGNLRLKAVECIGKAFRPVFFCTGIYRTHRTIDQITIELPLRLDSFELGAALIAHRLGKSFTPSAPIPWLEDARANRHLLPWVREREVYDARPICLIEREWFRVARKKLQSLAEDATEDDLVTFSCLVAAINIETKLDFAHF
jgi:hypothetical protein